MSGWSAHIPVVLMYHSVSPYDADPYLVTVRPERLDRQMRWLARRGLTGVSVRQLLMMRRSGSGGGLIGLTFDDGYADFAVHAMPILQHYGFTATVFPVAQRLGQDNAWDPDGPRKPLLTPEQLQQVAAAGMEIGSHGLRHVSLPAATEADLAEEVGRSGRSCVRSPVRTWRASVIPGAMSTGELWIRYVPPGTATAARSRGHPVPSRTRCHATTSAMRTTRCACGPREYVTGWGGITAASSRLAECRSNWPGGAAAVA